MTSKASTSAAFRATPPIFSSSQYIAAEKNLRAMWEKNLAPKGVKYPSPKQVPAIVILAARLGGVLSQDDLVNCYQAMGKGNYDRQLRHTAAKGWWLESGNGRTTLFPQIPGSWNRDDIRLASLVDPNPIWQAGQNLSVSISTGDWNGILKGFQSHGRGCAVCGRHFDRYDKGHLDPERPGETDNIVPMCTECNNWAANKAGAGRSLAFDFDKTTLVARPRIQTAAAARK